jgi:hypothetical protein
MRTIPAHWPCPERNTKTQRKGRNMYVRHNQSEWLDKEAKRTRRNATEVLRFALHFYITTMEEETAG